MGDGELLQSPEIPGAGQEKTASEETLSDKVPQPEVELSQQLPEGVIPSENVDSQVEMITQSAREVLDAYFNTTQDLIKGPKADIHSFNNQGVRLRTTEDDLKRSISELERLSKKVPFGDLAESLRRIEEEVAMARERARTDSVVTGTHRLIEKIDGDKTEWTERGKKEEFTTALRDAIFAGDPASREAAFGNLRTTVYDLGAHTSTDAKNLGAKTDDFVKELGQRLLSQANTGGMLVDGMQKRIPSQPGKAELIERTNHAAVVDLKGFVTQMERVFEGMRSDNFEIAGASDKFITDMNEVLTAAQFLRPEISISNAESTQEEHSAHSEATS